ncbi:MAG: hypothetical protein AAF216_06970 [Pseudomonadota bacterium]
MKRLITLAASAALFTLPALALTTTVDFTEDEGTQTWVFEDDGTGAGGTATAPDGTTGTYTFDAAAATLCGSMPEGDICVTFDAVMDAPPAVGDSMTYTSTIGTTGTATITAIVE